MRRIALLTLLLAVANPAALAIEPPCPDPYGNVAYPEHYDDPANARPDSDVERARAAVLAGLDPSETLPPTAAGQPYDDHPYLNAGKFGEHASATGCE
jgi:hypothetical protein